jgi:O-antigen/teichoic acid export membrane protein
MYEIVNESLQKIAKGAGIVLIGTIVSLLLGFIGRVVLIRFTTQCEYGIYSLAFTILSIFVVISTLGLGEGSTRYIAYFRGKGDKENVREVISSSIRIALAASIPLAAICFFASDFISVNIFHTTGLSIPLRIFSIAIPFSVLLNVFIAIFRGFGRVDAKVYFEDILRPILFLLFLIAVVLFNLSFIGVFYAQILSVLVTCAVFAIYIMAKKSKLSTGAHGVSKLMARKLLSFSVPLLAVSTLTMVMVWTDTLMLGYFKTPDVVGLYSAAVTLAHLLSIVINSVGFLFLPIMSLLYSKNQIEELKRSYAISTKWCFVGTLPLFFIFFLFPDFVLNLLFGSRYLDAAILLQVLSLGFIFNSYFGLNYYTLITAGKSKFLMQCFLISGVINIVLNMTLIPAFGAVGAAIASATSFGLVEVIMTVKLYMASGIHPFTKTYVKLTILSILIILIFYATKNIFNATFLTLPIFFSLFLLIYCLSILFTKAIDEEDIILIMAMGKRLGIDISSVKRFFERFA